MEEVSTAAPAAPPTEVSPSSSDPSMPLTEADTKPQNGGSSNGKSKKKRNSLGSKTYMEVVHEAIVSLKGRTGSSVPAIHKWILSHHPDLQCPHFKSRVSQAIKSGVKSERFAKVKCSYKISTAFKNKKAKKKAKPAPKPVKTMAQVEESNVEKLNRLEKELSPEEYAKVAKRIERQEAAARKKLEAEKQAKERADRLKRRKFPMEDTRLHQEDAMYNVKPPSDLLPRPYLPYFWNLTAPLDCPSREGKTSSQVLSASKADNLDSGSRGLVSDLLQVYHFFCGDVRFRIPGHRDLAPNFTLQHLIFSVEQLLNGNSKRSRSLPPLLVHLFCASLQILCRPPDDGDNTEATPAMAQLQKDLHQYLLPALNQASWADILFLYMDAMERFYGTDASVDNTVLAPLQSDLHYLFSLRDEAAVPMTPATAFKKKDGGVESAPLPDGYFAYFGDPKSTLARAFFKLARQDPWLLTAEEIVSMLRALTDDILSSHPAISQDMANRDEAMQNLARAKRAADTKLRKVRLAFEGPKKPATSKKTVDSSKHENGKNCVPTEESKPEPFKPTATRKQFDTAVRAQQKAADAYEKGIQDLTARTKPIGYDRHFNAVFCFRHDPEVLYVEDVRPPSNVAAHLPTDMQVERRSWHVVETASLFDLLAGSLDIRGRREHDLYEELVGPQGSRQSLRRFLFDDTLAATQALARKKEIEGLKEHRILAIARCDEEQGRRSGRLAGSATEDLARIEQKIADLEAQEPEVKAVSKSRDFSELTGFVELCKFEKSIAREARRSREVKDQVVSTMPLLPCSKLNPTGAIDGSGLVGIIVADMLEVEEHCERLAPWETDGSTRENWISSVESAVHTWNSVSPIVLGPPDTPATAVLPFASDGSCPSTPVKEATAETHASGTKRRKVNAASTPVSSTAFHSAATIVSLVRQPLIDLEARVAGITNLDVAAQDALMADDNMSVDDTEEALKGELENAWKKQVCLIKNTPTQRSGAVRQLVVAAIADARKAHLPQIVAELRSALLLYQPGAANQCKLAAVQVLEANGGYDGEVDEQDETDGVAGTADEEVEAIPSVVCAEAAVLGGCLANSEDASRNDWIESVKSCRTISRLASLVAGLSTRARERMGKIEVERDDLLIALGKWEKAEDRRQKQKNGKKAYKGKELIFPSEVWANVSFKDDLCMAKLEGEPYWPARKCLAKDPRLASSLERVNRSLVAIVGELGGLRVVKNDDIQPFTGKVFEGDDMKAYSNKTREQLDDYLAMARRISRGLQKLKNE